MRRLIGIAVVLAACAAGPGRAAAQEQDTPAAAATRKKLKTRISVDFKEVRIKDAVDELKREFDGRLGIKIDNVSGISNNSKVSLVAKDQTLEQILNALSDKYEFGYYVVSNAKDRNDGFIILRKSKYKERGYEEGKGPPGEKGASLGPQDPAGGPAPRAGAAAAPRWVALAARREGRAGGG